MLLGLTFSCCYLSPIKGLIQKAQPVQKYFIMVQQRNPILINMHACMYIIYLINIS